MKKVGVNVLLILMLLVLLISFCEGIFSEIKECYYAEEIEQPSYCPQGNCKILIIVESELSNLISSSLDTFSSDLKNELEYDVKIIELTRKSNEADVKLIITDEYNSGKLKGIFLIGNIPTVRVRPQDSSVTRLSDQAYYQDILNRCKYSRDNDIYDCFNEPNYYLPAPFLPPFWVSRIIAPYDFEIKEDEESEEDGVPQYSKETSEVSDSGVIVKDKKLTFLQRIINFFSRLFRQKEKQKLKFPKAQVVVNTFDSKRAEMINKYFENNHLFRTGQISTIKEVILYTPIENDAPTQAEISKEYEVTKPLLKAGYKQDEIHFLNSSPGKNEEFLGEIKKPYEFAFINAHGAPTWHQYDVNKNTLEESNSLILEIVSCNVGDFRNPDFIAGHYLMNGKTQFLTAGSTPIFGALAIDEGYITSLTNGKRIFEAWEFNPVRTNWFGDPTLKMRYEPQPIKEGPKICVSPNELDLRNMNESSEKITFKIYNKGSGTLELSRTHDLYPSWLFFNEKMSGEHATLLTRGGSSKDYSLENDSSFIELRIGIDRDFTISEGYQGYAYIVSNDANNPILKIPIILS